MADLTIVVLTETYMSAMMDMRDMAAPQMNYAEMYRQYITSLYHMSTRLGKDSLPFPANQITDIPSPLSPTRKSQSLWSPAKLVEMESSESGEEVSSGESHSFQSHITSNT